MKDPATKINKRSESFAWFLRILFSGLRAVGFGVVLFVAFVTMAAVTSAISFASGYRSPIGIFAKILDGILSFYLLPVYWLTPPYNAAKQAFEIGGPIIFWGVLTETFYRRLRRGTPINREL